MAFYAGMGGAYTPVNRRYNQNRRYKRPNQKWKRWKPYGDIDGGMPPAGPPASGRGWRGANINPLTVEGMRNLGKAGNTALRPYANTKAYKGLSWKHKRLVDAAWAQAFAMGYDSTIGKLTNTEWRNPWHIDYGTQWPMRKTNKHWRRKRRWR